MIFTSDQAASQLLEGKEMIMVESSDLVFSLNVSCLSSTFWSMVA